MRFVFSTAVILTALALAPPVEATSFTVTELTTDAASFDRPTVAVDGSGKLHVTYQTAGFTDTDLYYATNTSGSWSTEQVTAAGDAGSPTIAVTSGGTVYIAYVDGDTADTLGIVSNAGGSWTAGSIAGQDSPSSPSIALGPSGEVLVAFDAFGSGAREIWLATKTGAGLDSWSTERLTNNTDVDDLPALAFSSTGTPHIVYRNVDDFGNAEIYHASKAGGSWSISAATSGSGNRDAPSIAIDSAGSVYAAFVSYVDGLCSYAKKTGDTWTITDVTGSGQCSGGPKIAASSSEHPHLAMDVQPTPGADLEIHHAAYSSDSWQLTAVTTAATEGEQFAMANRSVAIDPSGYLHMVYSALDPNVRLIYHAKSDQPVAGGGSSGDGTCASPIAISCGDQVQGDTTGLANNISSYSCSGWGESGPEIVYSVDLAAPSSWNLTATISGMQADLDIFLMPPGGCAAGQCQGPDAFGNDTVAVSGIAPGTYMIAVDGFQGAEDSFTLDLSCTSIGGGGDNVSWLEIAAHLGGAAGSQWRTDVMARNQSTQQADVQFILHTTSGDQTLDGSVPASAMAAFVDIVDLMGFAGKGSLEVRSSQPLSVSGRIYNQAADGTFGQYIPGYADGGGLADGQTAWLSGLRQLEGEFRTNLSFTNISDAPATIDVSLFAADGNGLETYTVPLDPSELVQDLEPFKVRAGEPNLGWGFAKVTVTGGSGVVTSASVVDTRTNDATTVPMTQ